MTNEGEVYFALYADNFDPDAVTRFIGIEPTSAHRRDLPRTKRTSWKLSTGRLEGDVVDVYDLSSALVSKLVPYSERIVQVKQQLGLHAVLEVVLWITVNDSKPTPAIGFEPEVIAFLNCVGASIDVDVYRNMP